MNRVAGGTLPQVRITLPLLVTLVFLALTTAVLSQEAPEQQPAGAVEPPVKGRLPKGPAPVDVFGSYLNAVKKNDLARAKACWWVPGDDTSALDAIAGICVAYHRFNAAMDKAGLERRQFGEWFARDDCTDAAIDRTLTRLEHSKVSMNGDTAKLVIQWKEDDGSTNPAFWFSDDPIPFRRVAGGWRIDALKICGISDPEEFLARGSLGDELRKLTATLNEVAAGLESGKLKSAMEVVHALEQHVGSLEGRIPLTQQVLYEEDSPARYLRIAKGNPNVVSRGGAQLPHRKDIDHPTRIEGDLKTVFTEMYGVGHPKIVVETTNKKGYAVIFDRDDERAMAIVARQLGMTIGKEDREILALQLTVAKDGHHLKQVEKPPQRELVIGGLWTGRGRAVARIVPRRGSIVHRRAVERVPSGWETAPK